MKRPQRRPRDRALVRPPLEHDQVAFRARTEELEVDSFGHDAVLTGKAHRRGRRSLLARRDERIDASAQAVALRLPGRIAEPLGRQERRDGQRLCVAEREVRERRQPGLEAVDDVEAAQRQRQRQVGARADRNADAAPTRDRHGRAEGHDFGVEPVEQRAPSRRQSRARFDDASTVAECPSPRKPSATPATCSFTSWACDQANGVTRQMRRPTLRV